MIPNVLSSSFQYTDEEEEEEEEELAESGRVPNFHAGFFVLPNGRWVGLYYEAFRAHFLNLGEPAHQWTETLKRAQFTALRAASTPVPLDGDPN